MTWYEILLFLHIVAAILWLGAGVLLQVQAARAARAQDDEGLRRAAQDGADLGNVLFIPASLSVFVLGVLLVIEGPWSLDFLWVVLGLAGYLATFLTGILVMKPGAEQVAAIMERDRGMSADASVAIRKLLTKGRLDTIVLYLVVAIMVLKPTGEDVGMLVAMAAIVVLGVAYVVMRLRAIDLETEGAVSRRAPAAAPPA